MKKLYNELRAKLKDEYFTNSGDYAIMGSVGSWLKQCDVKPTRDTLGIVCDIMGSVPYPAQSEDRLFIINYLKKNKYKQFKKNKGGKQW